MVINKIISLCKNAKSIMLYKTDSVQWIGDGRAIYPLYGMPELSEENAFTIFDIPAEKRAKFHFTEIDGIPDYISTRDEEENEGVLIKHPVGIAWHGRELEPLASADGFLFVESKYLGPFKDLPNGVQLYKRCTDGGTPYIAAKDGMFLVGIIQPASISSQSLGDLLHEIGGWIYEHSPQDEED